MAREIDLDQAVAAEAEANNEPIVLRFKGETFELPPRCPWEVIEATSVGDADRSFRVLFGDEQWERFRALRPDVDHMNALSDQAMALYGLGDEGEAGASASSSAPTSGKSRQTSRGSTASTSERPSTVPSRPRLAASEP